MINVAILGAGIGAEHLQAYLKLSDIFCVTMIVDQDPVRVENLKRQGDKFKVETNIERAINDPNIHLIDICLPPPLHVPVTLKSIRAGKNVVCEKPLAASLAEIDQIRKALKGSEVQVFPVFQYRWGPALSQLRHLMNSGATGQPNVATLETHWKREKDYYKTPWRGTWQGEGGGAVLIHAIHNHDLLTHILGSVENLAAFTTTRINKIETEDCAAISFQMKNGALATSNITLGAAFDQTRLRVVFEKLTATSGMAPYAPGSIGWSFTARNPEDQKHIETLLASAPPEAVGFEGFFTEVGKALSGKPNSAVLFEDGALSIELVSAIYHSARTGHRVALPIGKEHEVFEGWLR